jgi:hypothetical protein
LHGLGIEVVRLPLKIFNVESFAIKNGLFMQAMYISTLNMEFGEIREKLRKWSICNMVYIRTSHCPSPR